MRSLTRLVEIAVPLLLAAIASTAAIEAPAKGPQPRERPPLVGRLEEIPIDFGLGGKAPAVQRGVEAGALLPWTRVAFQSHRNGDWEVYIANDDGSDERRLTAHPAADTGPRIDRGGGTVTFASNRDGDDEIYIMKTDGSGLRQLTLNGADDYNPAWSPDGSQIAFQSTLEGQSEVYVMRSDGSQLTRLTTNAAYDGMPSWSPDGKKIVFASKRTGGWRIWVMDANGANQHQLSQQMWSEGPVWSPDGSQIAYDADGNGDGWQELWLMDANGDNQRSVHAPGYSYDAWVSSWSPDGRYVAFTQAEWFYYQGMWYWVGAQLHRWHSPYGGTALMHPGDLEASPDWQTLDTISPSSSVAGLANYIRSDAEVRWSGTDGGGAGIHHFDVQFRLGASGAWTDWQMGVPSDVSNMATYPHQPGDTIYFRSRAVDNAFNQEGWPAGDGDTATTFYSWAISGVASDNRGTPLKGVSATGGASGFEIWSSDGAGAYRSYFGGYDLSRTITWDKSGYLNLPETSFDASSDAVRYVVLPPADNVIQDWGFEGGQFPSSAWNTGGHYTPTITDTTRHTGAYAAFMGLPFGFDQPTSLLSGTFGGEGPWLSIDGSGGLHALWVDGAPEQAVIYAARRVAGADWGAPQKVTPNAAHVELVQWGVSDAGRVHVIWRAYGSSHDILYHAWRDDSGTWSNPRLIYGQGRISPVRLVVDQNGDAHLVWRLENTTIDDYYYSRTDPAGSWTTPSRIGATGEYHVDTMAVGADGRVHLLWRWSGDDILYSYRLSDGTWSQRELVFPGGYNWYQRMVVTPQGQVHIVWSNVSYGRLYHSRRALDGTWSAVKILSENQQFGENEMQVIADLDGRVHIAWPAGGRGCYDLVHASIDSSGRWTEPTVISLGDRCVQRLWLSLDDNTPYAVTRWRIGGDNGLCLVQLEATVQGIMRCLKGHFGYHPVDVAHEADESVHAIWRDDNDIMVTETARARQAGDTTIAQQVLVPSTASQPTLSFMYLLDGARTDGGSLELSVSGVLTPATLFEAAEPTVAWTHQWLDLSPWSGQSITLTIQVHQVAEALHTSVYLDEVTLGTAHPDTWVTIKAPAGVGPGYPLDLVIDYGNRGGVAAEAGYLKLTLPAEITFVSAQPAPSTLTPLAWDLGTLPAGFAGQILVSGMMAPDATLDETVTLVASLTSSTVELETFNNMYVQSVQVGHLLLLPLIQRE